jgi:hypothetical protein
MTDGMGEIREVREMLGRMWLISLMARAFQPGCRINLVPVIETDNPESIIKGLSRLLPDPLGCSAGAAVWMRSSETCQANGLCCCRRLVFPVTSGGLGGLSRGELTGAGCTADTNRSRGVAVLRS